MNKMPPAQLVPSPFLSIIIPAHNEESRLPATFEKIAAFLKAQPYTAEVVVVENGSTDRTYSLAQGYTATIPGLKVIHEEQRGKGLAVKRGMLEARGEYRFICDADLSMPIAEIHKFLPPALPSMEIAIGSREAAGAIRYEEPGYRHFIGRVFNLMVRVMALPGLQDSQCGFKMFRGDIAEKVFPLQTLGGMSFDVEVLFIARRKGYRITEVAIPWYFNPDSRVRLFRDSFRMFFDLVSIRLNALRGRYD
jgi:glycosyltransferase involved in cell wall biosynthesis